MALKTLSCVCGQTSIKQWLIPEIVECTACGIKRVHKVDPDKTAELYASGVYFTEGSPDIKPQDVGRDPIATRLLHDEMVGNARVDKLLKYKNHGGMLIDVGCGNGMFMAAASVNGGFDVYGVDLSNGAQDEFLRKRIFVGDLRTIGFQRRTADVITFNDSFEHFVDPIPALKAAKGILRRNGILVIEIPDMGSAEAVKEGAKFKHVKPHEHLWYFTAIQLRELLEKNGFTVMGIDAPIPGKVTLYASPAATIEEIEILGPPGVGDIMWTLHKIRGIREREWPCRIKYVVCAAGEKKAVERAKDFLGLCKHIDSYEFRPVNLPRDVGCADPSVPVYELISNDYLDPKVHPFRGGLIEEWRPELDDDGVFDIGIEVPECAREQATMRLPKGQRFATIYMSSHTWNGCVAKPDWTPADWAEVFIRLRRDHNITPVILGSEWDADYALDVAQAINVKGYKISDIWINAIGRTSLPLAMAYMEAAEVMLGIANGLPMIAPYVGTPAVIMWPTRGTAHTPVTFCGEFEDNWISPELRHSLYMPVTIGKVTVDDMINEALQLIKENQKTECDSVLRKAVNEIP